MWHLSSARAIRKRSTPLLPFKAKFSSYSSAVSFAQTYWDSPDDLARGKLNPGISLDPTSVSTNEIARRRQMRRPENGVEIKALFRPSLNICRVLSYSMFKSDSLRFWNSFRTISSGFRITLNAANFGLEPFLLNRQLWSFKTKSAYRRGNIFLLEGLMNCISKTWHRVFDNLRESLWKNDRRQLANGLFWSEIYWK